MWNICFWHCLDFAGQFSLLHHWTHVDTNPFLKELYSKNNHCFGEAYLYLGESPIYYFEPALCEQDIEQATPLYCAYVLKLPKMTFYPALIKSVAISCVIYVLFEGVRRVVIIGSWFKFLFVCAGVGILGYVLVLILLFNKDERKKVLQMVLKRKSK